MVYTLCDGDVAGGYGDGVLGDESVSTEHLGRHQSHVQSRLDHAV